MYFTIRLSQLISLPLILCHFHSSLVAYTVKNLPAVQETPVWSLGWEDPLVEKGMATHSSILAWRIPWTEEPGRLWSIGLQRVGHDWVTNTFTFHSSVPFSPGPSNGLSGVILFLSLLKISDENNCPRVAIIWVQISSMGVEVERKG